MSETFRKHFTSAYEVDYGMAHILEFGNAPLQWAKKVVLRFDGKYVFLIFVSCHAAFMASVP